MSQQTMDTHSFVSLYIKPLWVEEADSGGGKHKELSVIADDYFSYLFISLISLY